MSRNTGFRKGCIVSTVGVEKGYNFLSKVCIKGDLHGTTFSHATSLRKAYDMTEGGLLQF